MSFVLQSVDRVERELYDRLYDEAFDKIGHERKRIDNLKEGMWGGITANQAHLYIKDDYVVGIGTIEMHGDMMFFIVPTWGKTQDGSRSRWYSEEYQEAIANFMRENNATHIVAGYNPESPAALAIQNHFGFYGKHLEVATTHEPSEIIPQKWLPHYPSPMRAFRVNIKQS